MRIGIITYDHPHRKTQDVLITLLMRGYSDIDVIALPWEERTEHKPLFPHRPKCLNHVPVETMCHRLKVLFYKSEMSQIEHLIICNQYDKILIGGCGIIPESLVKWNIVNSHPGFLPNVRGLDSLKWALFNGQPVGVTTHFIGPLPDTGVMIRREIIPVSHNDSFHSLARKVYDTEISMLCDAVEDIPDGSHLIASPEYPPARRMNHETELRMMSRFNHIIQKA